MDPRFKLKMDNDDAIWDRLKTTAFVETLTGAEEVPVPDTQSQRQDEEEEEYDEGHTVPVNHPKTALEELFGEEEQDMQQVAPQETQNIGERVDFEIRMYRGLPAIHISSDPVLWWWQKRDTLPLLYDVAQKYLCAQASSTPSERVFSTAGDTISAERSRILPEKADMLIFLHKNS
ncbi:Zinc finger BED domain-containing protein 1 [Merluccius polli]|uniref:Zinc finger BED domain-containing protein 1 n=1 Tax=Merluccius polli TaxID=89951 RepID=A0AA47MD22_MERPO|nr:Zinc finger BED domain-containing protein 1 [Merluccius polli]